MADEREEKEVSKPIITIVKRKKKMLNSPSPEAAAIQTKLSQSQIKIVNKNPNADKPQQLATDYIKKMLNQGKPELK